MEHLHKWMVLSAAVVAASLALASPALGQSTTQYDELSSQIKAPHAIASVGADLFGDRVNLYTGALEFVQDDITLKGNSAIPLTLGRRLQTGTDNRGQRAYGLWDLEIPYLHGVFSQKQGWDSAGGGRCSAFGAPKGAQGINNDGYFEAEEFWQGNYMYVPGAGDQQMLSRQSGNTVGPSPLSSYPVVTAHAWSFRCLASVHNGTGEGFVAVSPDGISYQFDQLVVLPTRAINKSLSAATQPVPPGTGPTADSQASLPPATPDALSYYSLPRIEVRLLPTRITDRFGNYVVFTYDTTHPANLLSIVGYTSAGAPDGRNLTFYYAAPEANYLISSVTDGARTWRYTYHATPVPSLDTVTLPDNSQWNLAQSDNLVHAVTPLGKPSCDGPGFEQQTLTASLQHPSSATGVFSVTATLHGRSNVYYACTMDASGNYYPQVPKEFYSYALASKQISGVGMPTSTWSYAYSNGVTDSSWNNQCTNGCNKQKTVIVTDPEQHQTRYLFGTEYNVSEGRLEQTDFGWDGSAALRTETLHYRAPGAGPYPNYAGVADDANVGDSDMLARFMPLDNRTITQQGETFTWQANSFDSLMPRALSVTRASSLGRRRTEQTAYYDNASLGVFSQIDHITESSTGKVMEAHTYDPNTALPLTHSRFGKLEQTLTWWGDGTLHTSADGDGSTHAVTYSSYVAGIPQLIQYPDGSKSAVVSPQGYIKSITELGNTTTFDYDAMGRLKSIDYPTGDTVAWNQTRISVNFVSTDELGVPGGHWRQLVDTGPTGGRLARTLTVYDALLRPIATRTWDTGSEYFTASGVMRNFDSAGHTTYESYPASDVSFSTASHPAGVSTTYDALGRVTDVYNDTELASGQGHATTSYNSGFANVHIDARGATTTSYLQAFDNPDAGFPMVVYPQGVKLEWTRDVFGKPLSLTRSGKALDGSSISAKQTYVYDSNERLCKTLAPETGATIEDYDGADNVLWRASGTNLSTAASCDRASVGAADKISFTYNAHNQLLNTSFGDGSNAITRTYTPDGLLATINSGNANWTYGYDKRRLLETETLAYGGQSYTLSHTYNAYGGQDALTYPGENLKVYFAPTTLGQPTMACPYADVNQCGQGHAYAYSVQHYPNGALHNFYYGNGIRHYLQQNVRGLPERVTDDGVINDGYSYDLAGNVVNIGDGTPGGLGTRGIDYDALGRVQQVRAPNLWGTITYNYDGLDNLVRTTVTGLSGHVPARTDTLNYNYALNRLTGVASTLAAHQLAYAYDARANISTRTNTQSQAVQQFSFDLGNRLKAAPGVATYLYDGHGRLVSTVDGSGNTVHVYDQAGTLVYMRPPAGAGTSYVHLGRSVVAEVTGGTTVKYDHTDGVGSTVATSNANGSINPRTLYEPYGAKATGPDQVLGFTGHLNVPELGLVYMQQRYYDPVAGRFLSIDPVTTDAGTGGGFNRYNYAGNSPYRYIDQDGRNPAVVEGIIWGAEIGSFGGPIGSGIGAVVVGGATLWLGDKAAHWIVHHNDGADAPAPDAQKTEGKQNTLQPGPHAGDSVPARGPDREFDQGERDQVNDIGGTTGCHTCGTTNPGTSSGNFVPDHQPPNALNPDGGAQRLYPHCLQCSRVQGGQVRAAQTRKPPPPPPTQEPKASSN